MGALCGKESRDDNFAGPGRRLDSSPPAEATAPLPKNKRVVVGGPPQRLGGSPQTLGGQTLGGSPQTLGGSPRTLGGSPRTLGGSTTVGGGSGGASAADDADPGSMAGKAAEARLKAAAGKGKLGKELDQQKRQTPKQAMERFTQERVREREIDRTDEQLTYN